MLEDYISGIDEKKWENHPRIKTAAEKSTPESGKVTSVLEGKVVKKYTDGKKGCIDMEAWAKNQRGEYTMPPNASTVILLSRENGPVVYPEPSHQLINEVKKARPLRELIAEGLI